MTTFNRSSPTYAPGETSLSATPVQEGSVRNLCPSLTPGNRGILSWVDRTANELRCAVLDDREQMFGNDVVETADVRTIYAAGTRTIYTGVAFVVDGVLWKNGVAISNTGGGSTVVQFGSGSSAATGSADWDWFRYKVGDAIARPVMGDLWLDDASPMVMG